MWIILCLIVFILYKAMLAPYVAQVGALYGQLKSYSNLLDVKYGRAKNLSKLRQEYPGLEKGLQELNKHFFSESEAENFLKKLPQIVSGFGNRIVLLRPKSEGQVLSRSEKLKKHVIGLHLPAEKDFLKFIAKNRDAVDGEDMAFDLLKEAICMIPESKRERFRAIWKQRRNIDPYARMKIKKTELEATIQGGFKGILSLLEWFDEYDKVISLDRVQIVTKPIGVETKFTLTVYQLLN